MLTKAYLVTVALIYFALALWCTLQPNVTSEKVGFQLRGASGQSEFMTVYGGLEFGIALILLLSAFRTEMVAYGVWVCVLIHASLVIFRTISFFRFGNVESITWKLAAGEWVIALLGIATLIATKQG